VKNYTSILILFTLLLIGFFLSWYVDRGYENYLDSQQALMQHSTRGAARLIELYIKEARQRVDLFTEVHGEMISDLSGNPDNEALQEQFTNRVKRHFPDFFAFTITNSLGEVLLDDIEGKVASLCQTDIHHFAAGEDQKVFIHPNPVGYHFDIMANWHTLAGEGGIFFVSLNPLVLSRILANSQLHDHRLILLQRDRPGLIEVTAEGTRSDLKGEIELSPEEMDRIGYKADVDTCRFTRGHAVCHTQRHAAAPGSHDLSAVPAVQRRHGRADPAGRPAPQQGRTGGT
jgi:hypothetical protein